MYWHILPNETFWKYAEEHRKRCIIKAQNLPVSWRRSSNNYRSVSKLALGTIKCLRTVYFRSGSHYSGCCHKKIAHVFLVENFISVKRFFSTEVQFCLFVCCAGVRPCVCVCFVFDRSMGFFYFLFFLFVF